MKSFTAVVERCPDTGFFVGFVPGFPGAHAQGATMALSFTLTATLTITRVYP